MPISMTAQGPNRPRIGIPWRTFREEAEQNRPKIHDYEQAMIDAGGEPVLLPLTIPSALERMLTTLDGFVLPGSPADVDPKEYGASNNGKSESADEAREQTDRAILNHAFAENKPVLAICYGCQLLNVHLGGTLIQDLRSETGTPIAHRKTDVAPDAKDDPLHAASFEPGSRLAELARGTQAVVNSSHHQAVAQPGRQLRVTGFASDGTAESIEWTGDANWVVGVQWHPERMASDPLAQRLFSAFVAAAGAARRVTAGNP
jgi:putative glutamine amidotransferase